MFGTIDKQCNVLFFTLNQSKEFMVRYRSDERAYYHQRITNTNVDATRVFIYPRLFSIHDITSDVGLPVDNSEEVEGIMTAGTNLYRFFWI